MQESSVREMHETEVAEVYRTASAKDMAPGRNARMTCPFCNGGANKESGTLAIYRVHNSSEHPDGYFYKCYRASCQARGFISLRDTAEDVNLEAPQPYKGPSPVNGFYYPHATTVFGRDDFDACQMDYMYPALKLSTLHHYAVKLTQGQEMGYGTIVVPLSESKQVRKLVGYHVRSVFPSEEKRTYWHAFFKHRGMGAWFDGRASQALDFRADIGSELCAGSDVQRCVVVVEDVLSALVVGQYLPVYCLLGTGINREKIRQITADSDAVILWTDPDTFDVLPSTTSKMTCAENIASKLRPLVPVVSRRLPSDPKELLPEEIVKLLKEDALSCFKALGMTI